MYIGYIIFSFESLSLSLIWNTSFIFCFNTSLISICIDNYFLSTYCLILFLLNWYKWSTRLQHATCENCLQYYPMPSFPACTSPLTSFTEDKVIQQWTTIHPPPPLPQYLMQALTNYGQVRIDPISFDTFTLHTQILHSIQ